MIYKDHPKRDMIITLLIVTIVFITIFIAMAPFLGINSGWAWGLIIIGALLLGGFPIWKGLVKKCIRGSYERKHGKKLQ